MGPGTSRRSGREPVTRALTPTEERIVRLVAAGRTNPEVAAELRRSRQTVEWHPWRAYRKLGVQSREQLGEVLATEPPLGRDAPEDEPSARCATARELQVIPSDMEERHAFDRATRKT